MMNTYPKDKFVCLDALTYAGNKNTIKPLLKNLILILYRKTFVIEKKYISCLKRKNLIM